MSRLKIRRRATSVKVSADSVAQVLDLVSSAVEDISDDELTALSDLTRAVAGVGVAPSYGGWTAGGRSA